MILSQIEQLSLETEPYEWSFAGGLFAPEDATALIATFPRDHFKTVQGYDGEKGYEYEARALINMGAETPAHIESLSAAWRQLAFDLLSPAYLLAIGRLVGRDLTSMPFEVNVFHYGAGAWLGPHVDLEEKILTHIFYFNESWNQEDGGNLAILRSPEMTDAVARVMPVAGNSVLLVRSEKSWHAVAPVAKECRHSRRSMTVTFYRPGSVSTMWPPGDTTPLHSYSETNDTRAVQRRPRSWAGLPSKDSWSRVRNLFSKSSHSR